VAGYPHFFVYYSMVKKENNKGEKVMSLKDKKVWLNGSDYIELDSVGSTLTSELMVFPTDCSEAPETASEAEFMMGVHVYDLDSEWYNSLSSDDLKDFFEFIELTMGNSLTKSVYNMWKTQVWGSWEEANNCYMNLEVA
tara:strand:- start:198 stop:614 length:417 start_codon:yes stop_codon:yes gene_type:complete